MQRGGCDTGGDSGRAPLTHQIDTKVNPGKQKAQEESEGHDACGGACSSSSHSTGTHQSQGQQHNPTTAKSGKQGRFLVTGTPGRGGAGQGTAAHFKIGDEDEALRPEMMQTKVC